MDVIKIRLMLDNELTHHTNSPKKYKGTFLGMRTLVIEEGYMALTKGCVSTCFLTFQIHILTKHNYTLEYLSGIGSYYAKTVLECQQKLKFKQAGPQAF